MAQLATSDQNFDLSLLLEIADGSDEFLVESIDMFLVQTPELMTAIYTALQSQDREVLAKSAHKLKPNLGFFGMLTAQAMMVEIEILTKGDGSFDEIKSKYFQVAGMVKPTLDKLTLIRDERQAGL
jgi:HPt (histidine-containing phosphotransfer) domain-containing protein